MAAGTAMQERSEQSNTVKEPIPEFNIDAPLWDLDTFQGRFKHFLWVTDFRTCMTSKQKLYEAEKIVIAYRNGHMEPGTTKEQLIYSKKLFESAFHPDSGELQNVIGRMSFQVPGGMLITGAMLQWYRQITIAYVTATTSALVVSLGLKAALAKAASPLLQRYVPFAAVAAANCANIPLMRQRELSSGVMTYDKDNNEMVPSKGAAAKGISQVVTSRIIMAAPGMTLLPIIMEHMEKKPWMQRIKPLHGPIQILGVGCCLLFMTPFACSIFNQRCSIASSTLEKVDNSAYSELMKKTNGKPPSLLYFNKGL